MNNIKKIRRVVDLSKPVLQGDTLYVANGQKTAAAVGHEETKEASLQPAELAPGNLTEYNSWLEEYVGYYLNAADDLEQQEAINKFIALCKEAGIDPQTASSDFVALVARRKQPVAPDTSETPETPTDNKTKASEPFWRRYRCEILLAGIIACLLMRK